MRLTLYGSIWASEQRSMDVYAAHLRDALRELASPGVEVRDYGPPGAVLAGWIDRSLGRSVGRYVQQYLVYQVAARFAQGDVNHITNHGYAHLAHSLDAARTVVTVHDVLGLKGDYAAGVARGARAMRRYWLRGVERAARVVVPSSATRDDLLALSRCDPGRLIVVPHGLDDAFHVIEDEARLAAVRRRTGVPEGHTLLHVGHCGFYKNVEGLLRIVALLQHADCPAPTLLKVGTPFLPHQRQLITELGIGNRVLHLGSVSTADLAALYNLVDVFVFPSLTEGFGWPPLEAMACGTPVVCSNAGSLREVVADAAQTCTPQDEAGFARAISTLLLDPAMAADYRRRGLRRAAAFSWRATAEQMMNVYDAVRSSSPQAGPGRRQSDRADGR